MAGLLSAGSFLARSTDRPARLSAVTERTLVLIKPDGVERRLIGEILSRIERKGLTIAALELKDVSDDLARRTTPNTTASRSSRRCWSSSPRDRSWRRSWRARGPLRRSGSSPAAPTRREGRARHNPR